MSSEQERRAATRVKVHLEVTFTAGTAPPMTGTVENISKNGVLLIAPIALAAQTRVRIAFTDPHSRTQRTIEGEVVRSAPAGKFGVSFVGTDEAALAFVRTLVEELA